MGLETEFSETIANFRYCLSVRNQYAHSHWWDSKSIGLGLYDLEELARSKVHLSQKSLTVYPISLTLLHQQEGYFEHVQRSLRYLANAYARKFGKKISFEIDMPAKIQQPAKHGDAVVPAQTDR